MTKGSPPVTRPVWNLRSKDNKKREDKKTRFVDVDALL